MPSPNPFGPAVGKVLATFPCEYKSNRGTLYVATQAVCFHSKFLGFETSRLVVPWKGVREIREGEERDTLSIGAKHNGGDVERVYEFRVLGSERCSVLESLCDTHQKYGGGEIRVEEHGPVDNVETGSSDNTRSLGTSEDDSLNKTEPHPNIGLPGCMLDSSPPRRSLSDPLSKSTVYYVKNSNQYDSEEDYMAACTVAAMADFRNMSKVMRSRKEALAGVDKEGTVTEFWKSEKKGAGPPADMLTAWKDVRDSQDPSYKDVACKAIALPCSLDDFYDEFLSDHAPHSMASFQKAVGGDTDFVTSKWTLSDDGFTLTRTMQYTHPVNAPMAPPSAQATKIQQLRRFGEHGLCIETRTVVDDIPMTDCFFVEDRLLAEPRPEGGVIFTAVFEVRFVKNTMFRKIIENTTRREFIKYWKDYAEMAQEALAKKNGREERGPISLPKIIVEQPSIEKWLMWLIIVSAIAFSLSQVLLLCEVRAMRISIASIEKELQKCR